MSCVEFGYGMAGTVGHGEFGLVEFSYGMAGKVRCGALWWG